MVFKLVRTDTEEPCKIQLPIGTHLIGRGKFLDCEDKRVSRKHGELQVTNDTLCIKSLHTNPCFYTKKGIGKTQVLMQGCTIDLYNGDKFGLLPDKFWFELMHCADLDGVESLESTQPMEETIRATEITNDAKDQNLLGNTTDDEELANVDIHEAITQRCRSPSKNLLESSKTTLGSSPTPKNVGSSASTPSNVGSIHEALTQRCGSPSQTRVESPKTALGSSPSTPNNVDSQSLLANDAASAEIDNNVGSPSFTQNEPSSDIGEDSPSLLPDLMMETAANEDKLLNHSQSPFLSSKQWTSLRAPVNVASTESTVNENNQSPTKRCHSPASEDEANKKIKTEKPEPQDVKKDPDPQPGPSGGNASGSSSNNGMPPSPVKPSSPAARPGRERCIYGANCYRKNPAHKAQFAHPADPDWGSGERGVCPYGRSCMRRDPRHWRDHEHPPGTDPPPAAPNAGNNRPVRQNKPTQKKRRQSTQDSDEDSLPSDLIVTGKRKRKTIQRQSWSGSDDDDNEDPFQTDDEEDDWVPGSQSQYTQDTQDD